MIQTRLIPLSLIDEPDVAMRTEIADQDINDLAADIARNGLIHPITVTRHEGRYRIASGHCRFLAVQQLGRDEIEAKDYTDTGISPQALMFSENRRRRDVNPADEALWLSEIQQQYHYDLDTLMKLTGESEHWISIRLRLFKGDQKVYEALRAGLINLGHATELNKFPDHFRQQYLEQVIRSTPPIHVVEDWRRQLQLMNINPPAENTATAQTEQPMPLPGAEVIACAICESPAAPWDMEFVKVHKLCMSRIHQAVDAAMKGQ